MKIKTKKDILEYLNKELEDAKLSNEQIKSAASFSPFGNSIPDLEKKADEYLKQCDNRISVQIWQKFRIKVLQSVINDISGTE